MERQYSLARMALSIFVDQKQLSAKTDLDQREEEKIILEEAKSAAPVVFAKRGDLFTWECTDRYNSYTRDEYVRVIKYIGRNDTPPRYQSSSRWPETPELGWLVFVVIEGNIYEHMATWNDKYRYYNADYEEVPNTLCVPLEKCGILRVYDVAEDEEYIKKELSKPKYSYELTNTTSEVQAQIQLHPGSDMELSRTVLSVFGDKKQLSAQVALEKREEAFLTMNKQLEEAKKVAPAIFANPGDLFTWRGGGSGDNEVPNVVAYVGRNDITPRQTKYKYNRYDSDIPSGDGPKYRLSPPVGWLVFGNADGYGKKIGCRSLLDHVYAYPFEKYELYDENPDKNTPLCIPPEKCGAFEVYEQPEYGDY